MKLKFNSILMVAVILFAACSDSDNGDPTLNIAQEIAGQYNGYTVAQSQYFTIPITSPGEKFTVTANEDGTANLAFESTQWGKSTISSIETELRNDTYTLKKTSGEITVGSMNSSTQNNYNCTVEGTFSKDKQIVSLVYVIELMGGTTVTFSLGDAPANMVIANSYSGTFDLTVSNNPAGTVEKQAVTIKSQEDDKAEVTLAAFSINVGGREMAMETIVIPDVTVAVANGTYTLTATINAMAGSTNVTGTLAGTIKDGKANLVFTMKPGPMPFDIVGTFTN